jgi:hypothetical protein
VITIDRRLLTRRGKKLAEQMFRQVEAGLRLVLSLQE